MPNSLPVPETLQPSLIEDDAGAVSRGRYVVLQALVGIMLAYQLLFGPEPVVSRLTSEFIVGGLMKEVRP